MIFLRLVISYPSFKIGQYPLPVNNYGFSFRGGNCEYCLYPFRKEVYFKRKDPAPCGFIFFSFEYTRFWKRIDVQERKPGDHNSRFP